MNRVSESRIFILFSAQDVWNWACRSQIFEQHRGKVKKFLISHLCLLALRLDDLLDFLSLDLLLEDFELLDLLLLLFLRPSSLEDDDSVDESEDDDSSELCSELPDPSESEEELLSLEDLCDARCRLTNFQAFFWKKFHILHQLRVGGKLSFREISLSFSQIPWVFS